MSTKGQIDIYATQATWQLRTNHIFARMYARLYALSVTGMLELVALQFGNGGSGSAASPVFGNRAFAVFRWKKTGEAGITTTRTHSFYMLIQYTTDGNIAGTQGPGAIADNPTRNNCMIGVSFAMRDNAGSDASPWAGGTLADGTDTKGSPVWGGTGDLYAFPRGNAGDGTSSNKREMCAILARSSGGGPPASRAHMLLDEDNVAFFFSPDDNGIYDMVAFVRSSPRAAIAADLPVPSMTMLRHTSAQTFAGALYPPTGAHFDFSYNGGTLGRVDSTTFDVVCTQLGVAPFLDANWEPNKQLEPNTYEEAPIEYAVNDLDGRNGRMGNLGAFLRVCTNVASHSTNAARTRAVFAFTSSSTDWRWIAPWDGSSDPGVSVVEDGVAF